MPSTLDPRPDQTPRLALGIGEAAAAIGVHRATLHRLIRDGRGPQTIRLGTRRLIRVDELLAWLSAHAEA